MNGFDWIPSLTHNHQSIQLDFQSTHPNSSLFLRSRSIHIPSWHKHISFPYPTQTWYHPSASTTMAIESQSHRLIIISMSSAQIHVPETGLRIYLLHPPKKKKLACNLEKVITTIHIFRVGQLMKVQCSRLSGPNPLTKKSWLVQVQMVQFGFGKSVSSLEFFFNCQKPLPYLLS